MSAHFVQRAHRFILQHRMIDSGETVLVGVSGGVDSLALLYALHALVHQLGCSLHVAHLDHGLRSDSAADAKFVEEHAHRLGLPISTANTSVPQLMRQKKLSLETAARQARYQFYESLSERIGATKIALGHHRGDQAETILMHLLRGAGASGLTGIPPVREERFIRPLLDFSRREIEEFVAELGLQPRQDPTNAQRDHLRNRIRLELIPLLEKSYNPNLQNGLSQTAELLGTESDYLDALARRAFQACRIRSDEPETVVLDRRLFRQHHLALQRRILRLTIAEISGGLNHFYFTHFESMLTLIDRESPNADLPLPNGWQMRRAYNRLAFQKLAIDDESELTYEIAVPGQTDLPQLNAEMIASVETGGPHGKLPDGKLQAAFDLDRLQLPLTLRNRRDGDRFQPFGMEGGKKVKDFLIDAKVPRQERDRIPILVSGDEIIWIVGYRTSDPFKIGTGTKRRLYLTYSHHS